MGEALVVLARAAGLPATGPAPVPRPGASDLPRWLEAAADQMGLEIEPVVSPYEDVPTMLSRAGPALLRLPDGTFVLLLRAKRHRVRLIDLGGRVVEVPMEPVRAELCHELERLAHNSVERILDQPEIGAHRREAVRRALYDRIVGGRHVSGCHILRTGPGTSMWAQVKEAGVAREIALLLSLHGAIWTMVVAGWTTIGRGVLAGRIDPGWLFAWALLLVSAVPLQAGATLTEGRIGIAVGALLKRRLLFGALSLPADEIRTEGAGRLLGRVIEAQVVESLALAGGFVSLVACLELASAVAVLWSGPGGGLHALSFLVGLGIATLTVIVQVRRRSDWTRNRLQLTGALVERMVGHRTRLVQQRRAAWHEGEDASLDAYHVASSAMDRGAAVLSAVIPRGWLIVGTLGLGPAFVGGADPMAMAVGLGGLLLGWRALSDTAASLLALANAAIAWSDVAPLYRAAGAARPRGVGVAPQPDPAEDAVVLDARDLTYQYPTRAAPVLREATLRIARGDRWLLEGPSGGGKSTFAAVVAGLRSPDSGLLLLHGVDPRTLGEREWRRRIGTAPQFHENHVLCGTFAFNLLMGRTWPPAPADLEEAEQVCRELGLGPLLDRMPSGIMQVVGESGWQLSHGERSRLFMARALLQKADLLVLDESFAALDPENLARALACVRARAPALLVIAHP